MSSAPERAAPETPGLDLSRYEGHTPGPWREDNPMADCTFIVVGDSPSDWLVIAQIPDEEELTFVETKANRALLLDAPALLAEVKRLRQAYGETLDGLAMAGRAVAGLTEERDALAEALEALRSHPIVAGLTAAIRDLSRQRSIPNPLELAEAALARVGRGSLDAP